MEHSKRYDQLEVAIADGDMKFINEHIKDLFEHIKGQDSKSRYHIYLLCRADLRLGKMANIFHMIKLAKLRLKEDPYALYIYDFVTFHQNSLDKANIQEKLMKMLENPEENIDLQISVDSSIVNEEGRDKNKYTDLCIEAIEAFDSGDHAACLELLNKAAELTKKDGHKMDMSVKFLTAFIQSHAGTQASYACALDTYKSMIGTKNLRSEADVASAGQAERAPMALFGLAVLLENIYRFKLSAKVVERGLEIVERKGSKLPSYVWPGTEQRLKFSEPDFLKETFLIMQQRLKAPPKPDAVCRFDACLDVDQSSIPMREIYVEDPDFIGYIEISCDNSCQIAYHPNCWKTFKESIGLTTKIRDKDMLGKECPTADCYLEIDSKRRSKIVKLVPYDKHKNIITVLEYKEPEPVVQPVVAAAAPVQPKKKNKPTPRPPQTNKTADEKKAVGKNARVNRGNAPPPFLKPMSAEQDETQLATMIVRERIPQARALHGRLPTLLDSVCVRPTGKNPHVMQLWFLYVLDSLRTSSDGSMSKDELYEAMQNDANVVKDLRERFLSSDQTGPLSKTELFNYILRSNLFGCVDDRICLGANIKQTSEWVANDFQQLYKIMYKVQFHEPAPPKIPEPKPSASPPKQPASPLKQPASPMKQSASPSELPASPSETVETESVCIKDPADFISNEFNNVISLSAPVYDPKGDTYTPTTKKISLVPILTAVKQEPEGVAPVLHSSPVEKENTIKTAKSEPEDVKPAQPTEPSPEKLKESLHQAKIDIEKRDLKIKKLESALRDDSVELMDQRRTSDKLLMELNKMTADHESLIKESRDKERMLTEHLEKARQEKDALAKQVKELNRQNTQLEKELNDKKKSIENSESSKGKKKKQDEIVLLAIQRIIQLIEAHWKSIYDSYTSAKRDNEEMVLSLLDLLTETSTPTYEEAMKNLQDWETVLDGVETSDRTLRTRLDGVRDKSKGIDANWASLNQILVPRVADMPKCIVTQACKDIIKMRQQGQRPPQQTPSPPQQTPSPPRYQPPPLVMEATNGPSGDHAYDFPMDAQYNMPVVHERATPEAKAPARPILPMFTRGSNGDAGTPGWSSPLRYTRDCPSPTSSVSSNSSNNCSEHSAPSLGSMSLAAGASHLLSTFASSYTSNAPTLASASSYMPSSSFAAGYAHRPPVASSTNGLLMRELIPNSLRQHVSRVNTKQPQTMADTLKKPELPSMQFMPATRIPLSDLKISLSFTEQQQKLVRLREMIPYTHENDFRQALHWLCQRRDDVRSLTDQQLRVEVCDVLTELLMTASKEELSTNRQDRYLMLGLPYDEPCSICLCPFRENNAPIHVLSCQHFFHKKCIRNWLETDTKKSQNCPNCRQDVKTSSTNAEFPPLRR